MKMSYYYRGYKGRWPTLSNRSDSHTESYAYNLQPKRNGQLLDRSSTFGLVLTIMRQIHGDPTNEYRTGILEHQGAFAFERVDAPRGVLRWRHRVIGTGQEEPVFCIYEVTVSHPVGPKGYLP